jgi:hypothetical protein
VSSIEVIWRDGIRAVTGGWRETLFSLKGLSAIMFILMMVLLLLGGRICSRVNHDKAQRIESAELVYKQEVLSNLRDDTGFKPVSI